MVALSVFGIILVGLVAYSVKMHAETEETTQKLAKQELWVVGRKWKSKDMDLNHDDVRTITSYLSMLKTSINSSYSAAPKLCGIVIRPWMWYALLASISSAGVAAAVYIGKSVL